MKNLSLFLLLGLAACQSPAPKEVPTYDIQDLFDTISISGGYFSSSEDQLIYSSNESGIYNIYEVDIASGSTAQLTSSDQESLFVSSYVPNSSDFIYSADQGGNEINHLYLQKRGGETIDLTPGENEKSIFYQWSQDNTALYYLSNKRDSRYFDLYKMRIDTWEPTLVYENTENLSIADISNNEQFLLLSQSVTTSENKFYFVDLMAGKTVEISTSPEVIQVLDFLMTTPVFITLRM